MLGYDCFRINCTEIMKIHINKPIAIIYIYVERVKVALHSDSSLHHGKNIYV